MTKLPDPRNQNGGSSDRQKKKKKSVFRDWTANTGGQNSVFHHIIANIGG